MAEIVTGRIVIERRINEDGATFVVLRDRTEKLVGRALETVEALGMLEMAKAIALADLRVEDA